MADLVKRLRASFEGVSLCSKCAEAANEIERLRQDYGQVVDKFDDCRAALARRVEKDTGRLPHPPDDDSRDWDTWLIEQSDKAMEKKHD